MNLTIPVRNDLELRFRVPFDAGAIYAVIDKNRQHLREWLCWADEATLENTREYIDSDRADYENKEGLDLGIWYQNQWVGGIGFHRWGGKDRVSSISYWLAKDFEGRGIMVDSVRALVAYGFTYMHLNRIEILCADGNTKSRAIPHKLGFKIDGVRRESQWLYTRFVDLVVYSQLRSEWFAGNS